MTLTEAGPAATAGTIATGNAGVTLGDFGTLPQSRVRAKAYHDCHAVTLIRRSAKWLYSTRFTEDELALMVSNAIQDCTEIDCNCSPSDAAACVEWELEEASKRLLHFDVDCVEVYGDDPVLFTNCPVCFPYRYENECRGVSYEFSLVGIAQFGERFYAIYHLEVTN